MLQAIYLGLGLFAPIGEISQVATSGTELTLTCDYSPLPLTASLKIISFTNNELYINTSQFSEKARIRLFKKFHLTIGLGWYCIKEELNNNVEREQGTYSLIGLYLPFVMEKNQLLFSETLYSTAPRGISMSLNLGFKL